MKKCPSCGKACKPVDKTCPECGAELDNTIKDFDADQAKLDAAAVPPSAPSAPAAPGAPKPPTAPGAPKPPSA